MSTFSRALRLTREIASQKYGIEFVKDKDHGHEAKQESANTEPLDPLILLAAIVADASPSKALTIHAMAVSKHLIDEARELLTNSK